MTYPQLVASWWRSSSADACTWPYSPYASCLEDEMNYGYTINVKCPMCGTMNKLNERAQEYYGVENKRPFILCCDMEEGGCDRYFVAIVSLSASVKTATYQEEADDSNFLSPVIDDISDARLCQKYGEQL